MKTLLFPLLILSACATLPLYAGDSKRTAEYVLANSAELEGKDVTLDVSFVKPVHWKSPLPEFAFFHAVTIDRNDRKPGGFILVAVDADKGPAFSRRYGMDFKGKGTSEQLHGTLLSAGGAEGKRRSVWVVDTTGKLAELIAAGKVEIPGGPDGEHGGGGEGPGRRQ